MGQMMALNPNKLERLAAQSNYPEWGISRRLNYITERGIRQIGVSGNQVQYANLTMELGFSSDFGVTNDRYPEEISHGQSRMMEFANYGIQISTQDIEDVDLYMQTLSVPTRRNVDDPTVLRGEKMFYRVHCLPVGHCRLSHRAAFIRPAISQCSQNHRTCPGMPPRLADRNGMYRRQKRK